ncbi:hypothetical protein ACFX12_036879 [Malus domestica]
MADALAEFTKRSAYFQQIEEDVQTYAKAYHGNEIGREWLRKGKEMSGFTERRIYKAVESTATEIFLRPSAQASSSPWYKSSYIESKAHNSPYTTICVKFDPARI